MKIDQLPKRSWVGKSLPLNFQDQIIQILSEKRGFVSRICLGPMPIENGKLICVQDENETRTVDAEKVQHIYSYVYLNHSNDDPERWAIQDDFRSCLNKDGEWITEPSPSSRDEEHFSQTRWPTAEQAVSAYESWKKKTIEEFIKTNKEENHGTV